MSADAVQGAGVEPIMARAVAARLRWKEALGLKDHFKGVVPASYKEAFEAIEEKMATGKSATQSRRGALRWPAAGRAGDRGWGGSVTSPPTEKAVGHPRSAFGKTARVGSWRIPLKKSGLERC